MNKRIEELAKQAAKYSAIMALPTGQSGDDLFVEKFAELIIKEVYKVADDNFYGDPHYVDEYIKDIEKHFGVEQ